MSREEYTINGVSLENIRNRFETVVIRLMKKYIPLFPEFDNCPVCIEDVYALALSRIPSIYMKDPTIPFEDDDVMGENIEEIVKYAIFQVSTKPKHEKKGA